MCIFSNEMKDMPETSSWLTNLKYHRLMQWAKEYLLKEQIYTFLASNSIWCTGRQSFDRLWRREFERSISNRKGKISNTMSTLDNFNSWKTTSRWWNWRKRSRKQLTVTGRKSITWISIIRGTSNWTRFFRLSWKTQASIFKALKISNDILRCFGILTAYI